MNKTIIKKQKSVFQMHAIIVVLLASTLMSCSEGILEEKPLSFINSDVALVDEAGFESAITALHQAARNNMLDESNSSAYRMVWIGTDVATTGPEGNSDFRDYDATLTPAWGNGEIKWNWAYVDLIPRANNIIKYAQKENVDLTPEQKNAYMAEARFLRAYCYNCLVNLFGGVPIVDKIADGPKLDFVRATRQQTLEFIRDDLIFASEWLPETTDKDGRIVKAAADHLLSEVYISLGDYESAITSATAVIESGLYQLMTERFGVKKDQPGDVYWDLFRDNNINRSSGNMETIWVIQIEFQTEGGAETAWNGNPVATDWQYRWSPRYWALKDPDGNSGMMLVDSLGRGVAQCRPNNYTLYDIWKDDWDDMRNSKYNVRREWYYNNPESAYFGQKVEQFYGIDTMLMYPMFRKAHGESLLGADYGGSFKDWPIYRLAETYLLRAEAYYLNDEPLKAADDINVVRDRARASLVTAAQVDLDYILDERARELLMEEPRRRTLVRMGKLVERVRLYNIRQDTRESIKEHHRWWPIPQSAIDANLGAQLKQNDGYAE